MLSLDRTTSNISFAEELDTTTLSGVLPAPGGVVQLRIVVDHSALEAFANGAPLAARVYPTREDADGVLVTARGTRATLRAWRMAPASR